MRLNPTLTNQVKQHARGATNAWAMFAVCHQVFVEASSMAYKQNLFRITRGRHRDLSTPMHLHPGMPYQHIQYLYLFYPLETSPTLWNMDHMWTHWLNDTVEIGKHFPRIKRLQSIMTRITKASRLRQVIEYKDCPAHRSFMGPNSCNYICDDQTQSLGRKVTRDIFILTSFSLFCRFRMGNTMTQCLRYVCYKPAMLMELNVGP